MSPEEPVGIEPPRIPGYRVIAPVGVGSRGVVYRARDLDTEDLVAVKVFAG